MATVEDAHKFYSENKFRPMIEICRLFAKKYPAFIQYIQEPDMHVKLYKKLKSVHDRVQKLTVKKDALKKNAYLSETFSVPEISRTDSRESLILEASRTEREINLAERLITEKRGNKTLKRRLAETTDHDNQKSKEAFELEVKFQDCLHKIEDLSGRLQTALTVKEVNVQQMEDELNYLREEYSSTSDKVETVEGQLRDLQLNYGPSKNRNLNKRIKRRDDKLTALSTEKKVVEEENKELRTEIEVQERDLALKDRRLEEVEINLKEIKLERCSLQKRISYLKGKSTAQASKANDSDSTDTELERLKDKVRELETQNKELQSLVNLLDDPEIITFVDGKYTDEIRQVIMELLALNVSMSKVDKVIKVVLRHLTNKNVTRLPSLGSRSKLLVEARFLAKYHVAESMLQKSQPHTQTGNCLHFDGTSKFHRNYQNWQVTLLDGQTLSLGLHEMGGADTTNTVESFQEIVDELAGMISKENHKEEEVASLLASIENTISDQGSVNPCFNRQLQALREKVLPTAIDNWNTLSATEREKLARMGNFFCKLHLLVNFATECDKTLKSFETVALEQNVMPTQFINSSESGPGRLVRTAVKSFHSRGSEEAGVASYFQSFLEREKTKLKLVPYQGNRFNVLFLDAAGVYFHRGHIASFLAAWPNPNKLLQAVRDDIDNKVNVAGIRALGIIDKVVTGPFWRLVKNRSILQVNPYLETMRQHLMKWCEDATSLMEGEVIFEETDDGTDIDLAIHRDEVYLSLFAETNDDELDTLTVQALELLMHSLLLLLERQAQDQLLQGKYANPDDALLAQAQNVPSTNVASERDFGILDLLVRMKPAGTVLLYESLTMWMNNRTSQWLNSKSPPERIELMREARNNVPLAQKRYKERMTKIKQRRIDALLAKNLAKEEAERKHHERKVTATNNLVPLGGVWLTEVEVDEHVDELAKVDVRAALVAQITFHKQVLKSKGDKELFFQSRTVEGKRIVYTVETLTENLKAIIRLNPAGDVTAPTRDNIPIIRPTEQRGAMFHAQKAILAKNLKEARIKRTILGQREQLPLFENDPSKLVGCNVKHKCIEEDETQEAWYSGVVVKIIKENATAPLRTIFQIQYEEDSSKWDFPLLTDMKKGDLIILTGVPAILTE